MKKEKEKIMKRNYIGMSERHSNEIKNRIINDVNFIGNDWFNHDNYLSHFKNGYNVFWILGSRGRGKTYSAKKLLLNRFINGKKGKFVWVRRSESALENLSDNKGSTFFEKELLEQKKVDVKVESSRVYMKRTWEEDNDENWKERGLLFALQSNEKWKGNQFSDYDVIVMDELVRGDSERRMFDNTRAFANTIETIAREREDVLVLVYANTIGEVEEFRGPLNYLPLPQNYGVYKFHHKTSILLYLEDSEVWRNRKKKTLAGRFSSNIEEFSNEANKSAIKRDEWIVPRDVFRAKKRLMFSLIVSRSHIFHVFEYKGKFVFTKRFFYPKHKNVYALARSVMSQNANYDTDIIKWVKEIYDSNKMQFTDTLEMTEFLNAAEKIGVIR